MMKPTLFQPIPGLWRFHLLYLVVTAVMGWSYYPYDTSTSLLLVAGFCVLGLIFSRQQWHIASHVLALAIGLGTPLVVFLGLSWGQTAVMFVPLLLSIAYFRRHLF